MNELFSIYQSQLHIYYLMQACFNEQLRLNLRLAECLLRGLK